MNPALSFDALSNDALLSATRELIARSNSLEADLIEHLGEIDERKLYLELSHPSMFAFCVDELGFSEDVTCNRINVARAGRRLPAIIDALRSGRFHLTGLRLLAPHLTEANHELLLPQAAGKSKRAIEELVARIAPSPPVRTWISRVPENPAARWSPIPRQSLLGASTFAAETAIARAAAAGAPLTEGETAAGAAACPAPGDTSAAPPFAHPETSFRSDQRPVVAPLSGETFMVRFTARRELRDKLVEAQGLLRHRVPDGDLPTIIEKALDLLLAQVKKERFAVGRKPRGSFRKAKDGAGDRSAPAAPAQPREADEPPAPKPVQPREACGKAGLSEADGAATPFASAGDTPLPPGDAPSRHIPDEIKRAVYERDGGSCSYVDERGRRCGSRDRLTFDHKHGFARTGIHSVEGLRLVCAAHNQYEAEKMYGREFMERARAGFPPPAKGGTPIRPGAD